MPMKSLNQHSLFSTTQDMAEEDNSWVFDSLVCFLNGPIWNAPLQSFIEEKSLIFEPNVSDNEDYKSIFDEFKNLVDCMLGNFMEDIGISPEQFEDACREGKKYHISFDHNLFELIWAANDYDSFKRMMTQRNVELQLQALELIEKKYGITPQSFIPRKKGELEESAVVEVDNLERDILGEVAKNFSDDSDASTSQEVDYLLEEKQHLEKTLNEVKELNKTRIEIEPPPKDDIILSRKVEVDSEELKRRQEYLRAQRDKLVALKKNARKKHLKDSSRSRPKSAKAAEQILKVGSAPETLEPQLQFRKTLAERLKAEVVSKK